MAIKQIKIRSTAQHSEASASPSTPRPVHYGSPARRSSSLSYSEVPDIQGQPSPSSQNAGTTTTTTTVDDTIPYYYHHHYPSEQEQEQQHKKHARTNTRRTSQSMYYPSSTAPSSSSSPGIVTASDRSAKTGRRTSTRPKTIYDDNMLPPLPPVHWDKDVGNDGASDHHSQKSSSSNSSSSNNHSTSGSKQQQQQRYDDKTEEERRRVEQLAKEYQEMEKLNRALEDSIRCEDQRFDATLRQFHQDTMDIRATDGDYSTIHSNLTILQAKIASLPLSLKAYLVDKQTATDLFVKRWPHLAPALAHLSRRKRPESTALDNIIISQLVEKLVTELLTDWVYQAHVHIGFPANHAFVQIAALMDSTGHGQLSLRFRQQLCKITARSTTHSDTGHLSDSIIKRSVDEAKAEAIAAIVEELTQLYHDPHNPTKCSHELMVRIHKIVEGAAEVSLAMRSQTCPVVPLTAALEEGKERFDPSLFVMQNGSDPDASIVQLVICPPFVFYENQQRFLTMKGKVICF
ncbi:hypothetical protein BX666DRAFT_2027662 [Dichotomocladium elegans]|nr:hypothetical protein BX666DRAFT_2027662 [Dichotomocladium elegans]